MRTLILATIGTALLAAAPAMAQTSGNSSGTHSTTGSSMNSGMNAGGMNASQIESKLKQDLSQAGFSDVKVEPGSFVVSAKDKSGQPVMMVMGPNSFTAVVAAGNSGTGNSAMTTGSTSNSSGGQHGSGGSK